MPFSKPGVIAAGTSWRSCVSGKGSALQDRVPAGHGSASRTIPAAGTCWFPASPSPFSRSPSQAGLGVSSSFSRTDEAGQVSKPARHARHEGGTGKRQGPTSLILSFTHYSTLLQRPPKREAKPVCNPQTHRALNLIIIELVGGGQAHAGAGGVPWVQ